MRQISSLRPLVFAAIAVGLGSMGVQRVAAQKSGAATGGAKPPDLTGVYDAVPSGVRLPNGVKTPPVDLTAMKLLPEAQQEASKRDPKTDPAKNCQVVGPFRMMSRDDN